MYDTYLLTYMQGVPKFLSTPYYISGMGKATNFKFCTQIHTIGRNKSPFMISAKVAMGVLRDSRKFSGHPYRAHHVVIFAEAQLFCLLPSTGIAEQLNAFLMVSMSRPTI